MWESTHGAPPTPDGLPTQRSRHGRRTASFGTPSSRASGRPPDGISTRFLQITSRARGAHASATCAVRAITSDNRSPRPNARPTWRLRESPPVQVRTRSPTMSPEVWSAARRARSQATARFPVMSAASVLCPTRAVGDPAATPRRFSTPPIGLRVGVGVEAKRVPRADLESVARARNRPRPRRLPWHAARPVGEGGP